MSFKEIQKEKTAQIEQILKAYLPRVQGVSGSDHGCHELQYAGRGKASAPNADAGDISDVWRSGQGDRAVYGCH